MTDRSSSYRTGYTGTEAADDYSSRYSPTDHPVASIQHILDTPGHYDPYFRAQYRAEAAASFRKGDLLSSWSAQEDAADPRSSSTPNNALSFTLQSVADHCRNLNADERAEFSARIAAHIAHFEIDSRHRQSPEQAEQYRNTVIELIDAAANPNVRYDPMHAASDLLAHTRDEPAVHHRHAQGDPKAFFENLDFNRQCEAWENLSHNQQMDIADAHVAHYTEKRLHEDDPLYHSLSGAFMAAYSREIAQAFDRRDEDAHQSIFQSMANVFDQLDYDPPTPSFLNFDHHLPDTFTVSGSDIDSWAQGGAEYESLRETVAAIQHPDTQQVANFFLDNLHRRAHSGSNENRTITVDEDYVINRLASANLAYVAANQDQHRPDEYPDDDSFARFPLDHATLHRLVEEPPTDDNTILLIQNAAISNRIPELRLAQERLNPEAFDNAIAGLKEDFATVAPFDCSFVDYDVSATEAPDYPDAEFSAQAADRLREALETIQDFHSANYTLAAAAARIYTDASHELRYCQPDRVIDDAFHATVVHSNLAHRIAVVEAIADHLRESAQSPHG